MRLRQLKVAGFRGFNEERVLEFSDRLTLIAAPNSHGKTSISEALEFLIYGQTSKVANAASRDEYRDSYRNRHFPENKASYVEAIFDRPDDAPITLRIELDPAGQITRYSDGQRVAEWPFKTGVASPFILQHALKYLLLVAPADRFQGLARLLGLDDVDTVQRAIVSLCTKPESSIPAQAQRALSELAQLHSRIEAVAELASVVKELKKGVGGLPSAYTKLEERADSLLKREATPQTRLALLIQARDQLTSRVFSGSVALKLLSQTELDQSASAAALLTTTVNDMFIKGYELLAAHGSADRLRKEYDLLRIGTEFMEESATHCPLCGQPLDDQLRSHIAQRHEAARLKAGEESTESEARARLTGCLSSLSTALATHRRLSESRSSELFTALDSKNRESLKRLFGKDHEAAWEIVSSAFSELHPLFEAFQAAAGALESAIAACQDALKSHGEKNDQVQSLTQALEHYVSAEMTFAQKTTDLTPDLVPPSRTLSQLIDSVAGTSEHSIIIEMLEKRPAVTRAVKVRDVLSGLKELKRHVEQTVGETMEAAINTDLSGSVMDWYSEIRTTGDPDVHFSGLSMDRTKGGDFKSRKVKISAHSYGVELSSAVSSLSESKLNALGLCLSIAAALRSSDPWGFLVIDDPIQSWDEEHENQFMGVVRRLIEDHGRQIILLSHKSTWIDLVCKGCRSLNGIKYHITGYVQSGPIVRVVEWAMLDQRLREAKGIAGNPHSTPVKLQQAEEELRFAACQIASEIASKKLQRDSAPHKLNGNSVRSILIDSDCPAKLADLVLAVFVTVDHAHHAPKDYQPNAERIRQNIGALDQLRSHFGV